MAKRLSSEEVRGLFKKKPRTDSEKKSSTRAGDDRGRGSRAGFAGVLGGKTVFCLAGWGISLKRKQILEGILQGLGANTLKDCENLDTPECFLVVSKEIPENELLKMLALHKIPKGAKIVTDEWVALVSSSKQVPPDDVHAMILQSNAHNPGAQTQDRQPILSISPPSPIAGALTCEGSARVSIGGRSVDAYGMGTLALGVLYPDPAKRPSREEAIRIVEEALRLGTELFDAADSYGADGRDFGYVERLLHEAITQHEGRSGVRRAVVATKSGMMRINKESNGWRPSQCRPDELYNSIRASWTALGGGAPIFLWQLHHPNEKATPLEVSLQAAKRAQEEGLITNIGLCNVTLEQIKRARTVVEIQSVQNEFSLWTRTAERNGVLDYCSQNGLAFMAHGCLGGVKARRGERSVEDSFPQLREMAARKGVSVHALVLALTRHRWPGCLLHIPGCRRIERVRDVALARGLRFTAWELAVLDGLKPINKK